MKNFIGCFNIGYSGGSVAHRNIGYNLHNIGWMGFVEKWAKPLLDKGVTRIELHNPGGTLPGEDMQADQFIHARNAGLNWVAKDFAKAWKPITNQIEVIAYLGLAHTDANLVDLKTRRHQKDNWLYRMWDSYRLPLDAEMSIGFDAIHNEPETSPEYHFVKMIEGLGFKTYIEPWPVKSRTHWFSSNHITVNSFLPFVNQSWAADESLLTGEKVVMINQGPPVNGGFEYYWQWGPSMIRSFQEKGWTVMAPVDILIENNETLEQFLARP